MKSLIQVDINSEKRPNMPTLRQWLKTVGNGKIAQRYPVVTVWKPNQFPNYTFVTEKFKVRISENNPVFNSLVGLIQEWYQEDVPIAIAVSPARDGNFDIVLAEGENVDWKAIGEAGYEIKLLPKRDSAKPVSSPKS